MKRGAGLQRVQLWVPDLTGTGGIQHYSRMVQKGLTELLPQADIRVLAKKNAHEDSTSTSPTATARRLLETARFCSLLLKETIARPPDLAILTHLHFAPVAYVLKQLTGLRYWVSAHGVEAWRPLSPLLRKALAGAERILPVSHHTQHRLSTASRLAETRFSVLPNTVDHDAFYPGSKPTHLLRRYGLRSKQKLIFTLARLDSREGYKGHDRVLEALPQILKDVPDLHYVIAGRGEQTRRIHHNVQRLGLNGHVTLTGFLPERDLRDHYNLCDVFAMPSQGEGFGIVYLEALACGRPVLAGNQDGSREPLLEGKLGALVDPQDPSAIAQALLMLLAPSHPDGQAEHLRQQVVEQFGWDAFKARLGELLNI